MKQVKDFIASILYRILVVFAKLIPATRGHKHLLLIKLDEIGDYMLFRNFLKDIRNSERYKDYKITLLGNAAWKPIFDVYDSGTVDNAIWITKKKFNRDLAYRFSLLRGVRKLQTSDVINCIFSRSMILDDGFAYVAKAEKKTAMKGDNSNTGRHTMNVDSWIYTEIVDVGDKRLFESIRNRNYYSLLLGEKLSASISLAVVDQGLYSFSNYYVIFIGAGNKPERKWPVANFVACAAYIFEQYQYTPVICGGPPDEEDAANFMKLYPGDAVNLAGKTSLPGFIELTSKAKFLLSVDTGPVHMAAASGCPVVALYSGVHYGRYAPYAKEASSAFVSIYCDYVDRLVKDKNDIVYDPFMMKNTFIGEIQVEKVKVGIDAVMHPNKC